MKQKNLFICDATIHPGEHANLAMPLPEQFSCSPLYMPIQVLHGSEPGPCLVIFSILIGNELNGLEIINRIVQQLNPKQIKGTIIAVPALNIYGLTHYPATLPTGHNLADCFPGKEEGSFGERMAYLFTQEILKKANYCIELQTGELNHNILPQVYCNFSNVRSKELAKIFQAPVVTNVSLEGNNLRQATEELQIPLIVYEAGEAMRFDQHAISLGIKGINNIMREIDILPKEPKKEINPIFSREDDWIVASKGGILHAQVDLGQTIKEKEVIGCITDPFGVDFKENIYAPQSGVVVGINMTPLIHEGLPIFKIASFIDDEKASDLIEAWDKKQSKSIVS